MIYGWHPSNYADALDPLFAPVLLRSVGYAAATAALCLVIGYPVAYTIARYGGRWKNALIAADAAAVPHQLPRAHLRVGGAALRRGARQQRAAGKPIGFLNTPWAVIGGLVYGYLGFMILPIYASLERMDPALIEAGKDLYGTPRADLLARHLAADAAGRAGGHACSSSCPRSATSSRPSCSAGPTPT